MSEDKSWDLGLELHNRLRETVRTFLEEQYAAGKLAGVDDMKTVFVASYMLTIDALAVVGVVTNRNPMKLLDEMRPGTVDALQRVIRHILEQVQTLKASADAVGKGLDAWSKTTVPMSKAVN